MTVITRTAQAGVRALKQASARSSKRPRAQASVRALKQASALAGGADATYER